MADAIVLTWTTVNRLGGVGVDHFTPYASDATMRDVTIDTTVAQELGVPAGRYERIHIDAEGRAVYRKQD